MRRDGARYNAASAQISLGLQANIRQNATMLQKRKEKSPRLDRIFQKFDAPVFFATLNTHGRAPILARSEIRAALESYCQRAEQFHIGVGRYVIMPDHVHLFVSFGAGCRTTLGVWVRGLKRHLEKTLRSTGSAPVRFGGQVLQSFWQPGFHDHLLRNDESYAEKWNYVRENPVRAGLVSRVEDWPYQGEVTVIDRV
jgi:REP element-mobilizing transposase RayT